MTKKNIITWDLGATKCAAALVEYDEKDHTLNCKKETSLKIRSCSSLKELVAQLEQALAIKMADADAICIGAAGHYDGENLYLEAGYPYPMEFNKLIKQERWAKTAVIHDYSPIICATFTSYMDRPENIIRLNSNIYIFNFFQ